MYLKYFQYVAVHGDAGSGVLCHIQNFFGFMCVEFHSIRNVLVSQILHA